MNPTRPEPSTEERLIDLLEAHVQRTVTCDVGDWTPYGEQGTTWNAHLARAIEAEARPTVEQWKPVLEAANDVRRDHVPNQWDSCVSCRRNWPCDAELLAELVTTRAALDRAAAASAPSGGVAAGTVTNEPLPKFTTWHKP